MTSQPTDQSKGIGCSGCLKWGCLGLLLLTVGMFALLIYVGRRAPGKIWHAVIDTVSDDTAVKPCDPAEAKRILSDNLGRSDVLKGVDVRGVWVEGCLFSYGYFLYKTNEADLLKAVATAPIPTTSSIPSDVACQTATWDGCRARLLYEKGPQRNLPGWNPELVAEKRCYKCLRFPWDHTILIDGKTGLVYHSVSEIRE